jgi:hypothetical protein
MTLADHLRSLEEQLLDPATRTSPAQLNHLLAPDFLEFGSSGRTFTRAEILAALASELPAAILHLSDFNLQASAPGWALVTYRSTRITPAASRSALRSSTWIHRDGRWQLLFHQGTLIPPLGT